MTAGTRRLRLFFAGALGAMTVFAFPDRAVGVGKGTKSSPAKGSNRSRGAGKAKAAKVNGKGKGKDGPPDVPAPTPGSKVAVFPFAGDGAESIHRQVLHLLRGKGLKPNTTLRPMFDTPEQYRETATALGLAAYVDGEVSIDGPEASATIHLRSGATGLRIWSATFSGERRQLASEVGKRLWEDWSSALGRACVDAAKPRKLEREPMQINAGTPIADHPPAGE